MEIPQETEDYIRESIDHTVGLRVSTETLYCKFHAVEAENVNLRHQYLSLQSKLREKDEMIERSRAEASMNALALKKFVEENQKLAIECSNLLAECNKWKGECSLYDRDREALMDFANEADERAKEADIRNHDLEEEKKKLEEQLLIFKFQSEHKEFDASRHGPQEEKMLLDSLLTTTFGNEERTSTAHNFLEAHRSVDVCKELLSRWSSLMPSSREMIALVANVKNLAKDKDNLTVNLLRAEDEVTVLFEENSLLNEEINRLMRKYNREKPKSGSGGAGNSGKGKRKSSPAINSPEVKKIDSMMLNNKDRLFHRCNQTHLNPSECTRDREDFSIFLSFNLT